MKSKAAYPSFEQLNRLASTTPWRLARLRMFERYMKSDDKPHSYGKLKRFLYDFAKNLKGSAKSISKVISMIKMEATQHGEPWLTGAELDDLRGFVRQLRLHDKTGSQRKVAMGYMHILTVLHSLNLRKDYDLQAAVLLLIMYDGIFRTGEILRSRSDGAHLRVGDCTRDALTGDWTLYIGDTKTDFDVSVTLYMRRGEPCACWALDVWWARWRLDLHKPSTPVFFGLLADRWRKILKWLAAKAGLDPARVSGHSLRRGSTSDLFAARVPLSHIKFRGRWKSNAVFVYYEAAGEVARSTVRAVSRIYKAFMDRGEPTTLFRGKG